MFTEPRQGLRLYAGTEEEDMILPLRNSVS